MKGSKACSGFAKTQLTLLAKLVETESGVSEVAWNRFFELYYPAMVHYARFFCRESVAEDVVQEVLVKLVDILRTRRYVRRRGVAFRAYLKTLIRNEFLSWRRREAARGDGLQVGLNKARLLSLPGESVTAGLDAEWRLAVHRAATEHVLTQMALADKERRAYRGYVEENRAAADVAQTLGVTVNYVYLAKSRIERRIAALIELYGDGDL